MSNIKRSLPEDIDLTDPKERPWGEDDDDKFIPTSESEDDE